MKKGKYKSDMMLPRVRHVQPRLLADDLLSYIPGDKENMAIWDKSFEELAKRIKEAFDRKGIPMPTISIDTSPGPITYGVATTDASGNILHTLIPQK